MTKQLPAVMPPKEKVNGNGEAQVMPLPLPDLTAIFPILFRVSGLYEWRQPFLNWPLPLPQPLPTIPVPQPQPLPGPLPEPPSPMLEEDGAFLPIQPLIPLKLRREELRVDVDGRYPQMTASGTLYLGLVMSVHWIASLTPAGSNLWNGVIWYKDGAANLLPYTNITLQVKRSFFPAQQTAVVTFSGGGAANLKRTYSYKSPYFHKVEFEFDTVSGTTSTTSMNTCDHPNRPASLPCETLTIETVFQRAGFDVRKSGGDGSVPANLTGGNGQWSNMEMHDAMQTYWSRFANVAQWSMWTLFAGQHEIGTSLGGIMFDDIGPNHRQGTAMFNDSFISNPPAGDTSPAAWVRRMRFWTACHEMGHSFNLAHSWQKQHPPAWGTPWIPLTNEPEARSFMNYPFNVTGGQTAFFADFEFRFSDNELLFLRHAPARFVQMGNADWFDHHGFQQALVSPEPNFTLELRANRPKAEFEFMEAPMLELKLTNISGEPQVIRDNLLSDQHDLTVIIKKDGKPARQFVPYATYCWEPGANTVLDNDKSLYESLFISAGRNGWDLAEPGYYTVQVALHLSDEEDIISNELRLRVNPPRQYEEEYLAQDFFSDEVGRIYTFGGSQFFASANDVLQEIVNQLKERAVAIQAQVPLGNILAIPYKYLYLKDHVPSTELVSAKEAGGSIKAMPPKPDEARKELSQALLQKPDTAAKTLGHIGYHQWVNRYSQFLSENGDNQAAAQAQTQLHQTLSKRNVLDRVLKEIERRRDTYAKKK